MFITETLQNTKKTHKEDIIMHNLPELAKTTINLLMYRLIDVFLH